MIDKINKSSATNSPSKIDDAKKKKHYGSNKIGSKQQISEVPLLENSIKPSPELKIIVEEKGVDFARKQLVREILINKFGLALQGTADFELTLTKLNEKITSTPELKNQYDNFLMKL